MRYGPGVRLGCRAVFLSRGHSYRPRAERHPVTPKPTSARRHACGLKQCAVDWYGIRRRERQKDKRQPDAIDPVLFD